MAPQIDYLVYSADLPTAISLRSDLGQRQLPRWLTPVGSSTGLTYLYRYTLAKNPNYLNLQVNRYARLPVGDVAVRALKPEDIEQYQEIRKQLADKNWQEVAQALKPLVERHPRVAPMRYNLACALAQLGELDAAMEQLTEAVASGWSDATHTQNDADLAPLADRDDFKSLLDEMRRRPIQVQPSLAFSAATSWSLLGEPAAAGEGDRYLLSSVLAVTSGRGLSVAESVAALRRSAESDGTRPGGTIYFCRSGDKARSGPREPYFDSAVKQLAALGVKAEVLDAPLPRGKHDVQGVVAGVANVNWKATQSEIRPGAFCDHLTSLAGVLTEGGGQTPLTEWLRSGAAGSSGTVTEPYNLPAKFPSAFLHVHYAEGCSLAEAFYQSVAGPYQQLLVGDPLCQPWARIPEVQLEGFEPGQVVGEIITLEPKVVGRPAESIDRMEVFLGGRRVASGQLGQKFRIDTREHPDGWHEIRIVAVAGDPIATQGGTVLPLIFANGQRIIEHELPEEERWRWDQPYPVTLASSGADRILLVHHDRVVATIEGDTGTLELDLARLGPGTVTLQAVAVEDGTPPKLVHGEPWTVVAIPPRPRPPIVHRQPDTWKPGLLLSVNDGRPPAVVDDLRPGDWLENLKLPENAAFVLSGRFEIEATELYQFQWRGDADVRVEVDGQVLGQTEANTWAYAPIALREGFHEVLIHGTATKNPKLTVRFGRSGTRSLDQGRFICQPDTDE